MSRAYLNDFYQRNPTYATYLGIHRYNDRIEDYSRQGVTEAIGSARQFRGRAAIHPTTLTPTNQLDHEQLLRAIDSRLLTLETIQPGRAIPTPTAAV